MSEFATVEKCKLCGTRLERDGLVVSTLTEKGCTKIKEAGVKRGKEIDVTPKEKVHEKCRNEFCHPFYINRDNKRKLSADSDGNGATPAKLRSKGTFNFATDCLFCGLDVRSNFKEKSYPVKTLEFQITLLETCKSRGDEWAQTVNARIQTVSDLHAADAVYHQTCSSNFRTSRGIPKKFRPENQESASTTKQIRTYAPEFLDMTQVLEDSSDDQMTVSDLVEKMKELHGEKAYSMVWMKQKLKEYNGESILISGLHGKSNVITFRKTAASILHEFYKQNSMDSEEDEQKHQMIRAAAALIRSEVLALECDKSVYVSPKELSDMDKNLKSVPRSLQDLLSIIFGSNRSDVKKSSIGQAIVQATRPRSFLCPLQLGLGVQVHHLYASRFLVDTLYNLGFSVSYSEVMRFEASAAMQKHNQSYNIQNSDFLQFVADNVDHNTDTLDGKNTFHGMGMIASITPHPKGSFGRGVPRLDAKPDDIAKLCNVDIQYYVSTPSPSKLRFKELLNVPSECIQMKVDILSKLVRPLKAPIPIWSGMMQLVGSGSYPGKSFIDFLPIIDMNPGDPSCVFSTLQFVCKEADKYDRKAVITFDQPLYWKAILIAEEKSMDNIVVRLGGFHTQMSFLGSIGHIMSGSGLKALLEIIYASNSVNQMLSGKAVSRAVRGYMLVDAALALLLHEITFGKLEANNVDDERNEFASKLKYITECYDKLSCKETNVEQAVSNDTFKDLEKEVEESTTLLRTSRTSQL